MTELITNIKLLIAVIAGGIAAALGGCDTLLMVLLGFMAVDYLSGVILAIKQGKLNSRVGFMGILKKALILAVVFLAHLLDEVTGLGAIRSMTVMFYISNEGISVVENLCKLGVKIPQKFKEILEQLEEEKNENTEDSESDN